MKETRFYVVAELACPECRGSGKLTHPFWEDMAVKYGDALHLVSGEAADAEAREWGLEFAPDAHSPCYECEGSGTIEQRCDLREALKEIERGRVTTYTREAHHGLEE